MTTGGSDADFSRGAQSDTAANDPAQQVHQRVAERAGESAALADRHDALLVDLDGTLILAGHPIPEAAESLTAAAARGARPMIVTNNASRSPNEVAEALRDMGFAFGPDDVVNSPQVAAAMLAQTHPTGARVLVVGTDALCDAVRDVGLVPVRTAPEAPVAVVQGHSPDTGWRNLAEACIAIRGGADWVATNADTTLPTDRGLLPGNGSMVAALVAATGLHPRVAGKPARPLLDAAAQRVGATAPLVVGDRLDTDIAAAVAADMPSLFVLTGVSTPRDLIAAGPDRRPTWVSADLRGLLDPSRIALLDGSHQTSGWAATARNGAVVITSTDGESVDPPVFALAAAAVAAWAVQSTEIEAGDPAASAALQSLGLVD
jgi:HAD superfamily hydrolase (TIGR01450 family)